MLDTRVPTVNNLKVMPVVCKGSFSAKPRSKGEVP